MIRNYFTVAWRTLRRRPGFSALNVVGLAVGLACVILIGLWVEHELSYDDFHPNADRTYRVLREFNTPELNTTIAYTPSALAPTLTANYPQVQTAVRTETHAHLVQRGPRTSVEEHALYADAGFFDLFGVEILRGTARLNAPGTVVLTPTLADKYFPQTDPLGKTLRANEQEMEVTGIVEPPPSNTHLHYSLIASLATRSPKPDQWGINNWRTYVRLQPGTSEAEFEATFEEVVRGHLSDDFLEKSRSDELPEDFHLQPITGIHLGVGAPDSVESAGSLTYVYLFSALALFVLLLACINFMNLSTARSARRANEVGVRKAMGAGRSQLAGQFLGESLLMTALALVLALGLCALLLPLFNDLAGTSIGRLALVDRPHLLAYGGLLLVVGLLAGTYPALVLSGYRPIETLRARASTAQGSLRVRQALVVFQFAISIALIAGTAVVHRQVQYMQSKGLGFQEKNVLVLRDEARSLGGRRSALMQELESQASVKAAACGYSVPGSVFLNTMWTLDRPEAEAHNADYSYVGPDYVETLGLNLIAGRDFSRDRPSDTSAVLINEAAAKRFGFSTPQEAIGEAFVRGSTRLSIIGVLESFHYESLHEEIYPLILMHEALRAPRYIAVRIKSGQKAAAVEAVRSTWRDFSALPPSYSFLANDLSAQYEAERRMQTLFAVFAVLAILIACLGLFGLAAYAAQRRTKEIGIRKALGATVTGIIGLLSKDFLTLVGLAFAVGTPVAYLGLKRWLQNFAYHIDLGAGTFLVSGALAVTIAALTVGHQAWRVARTDPASTLRSE